MIARLVRLAAIGAVAAYVIDRVLAARRGERPPAPIQSMVVIEAPIERVWDDDDPVAAQRAAGTL